MLLIDKPAGWTSFDVVAKVRGMLRRASTEGALKVKVGHIGTLDPLATGLLVLMVGSYTKKVPEYSKLDKTYEVTMRLGQTSTTGDEEGQKTDVSSRKPSREEVEAALKQFVGDIMQTPPIYSAIKINGQRAYKLAREGKVPDLQPRPAKIYRIEIHRYNYPLVEFTAEVSSGTYIRSLVADIGDHLQTGAYMPALRRTKIGPFNLADASQICDIETNPTPMLDTVREKQG